MFVSFTILRYPIWAVPFAFIAMALFRLPLSLNRNLSFYKLMGCGKNGTFDKVPDLRQWAILCVHRRDFSKEGNVKEWPVENYGRFIGAWIRFFGCERYTLLLQPMEGHGLWDGKKVFGELKSQPVIAGPVAVLTRATIRLSRLSYFWKHVAPVARQMRIAKGFITSVGIGEIPWVKQATFSAWQSMEDMKAFAYGMKEHRDVIRKTRQERWYSEEMFTRFNILQHWGTIRGVDPLEGKL